MNLKNKYCVKCYGCYNLKNSKSIVTEYAINKDLSFFNSLFYKKKIFQYLKLFSENLNFYKWMSFISESMLRFFINQIIGALNYLYQMKSVHLDLKLENLLLYKNFNVRLADFALATNIPQHGTHKISTAGTKLYMAPECFSADHRNIKVDHMGRLDYFSLGVILMKMATNKFIYKYDDIKIEDEEIFKYEKLKEKLTDFSKNGRKFIEKICDRPKEMTSDQLINFMRKLLEPDINKRPDLPEIENHPWLKINEKEIKSLHDMHDNDYLKFIHEVQKLDFVKKDRNFEEKIKHDIVTDTIYQIPASINKKINSPIKISKKMKQLKKKFLCYSMNR